MKTLTTLTSLTSLSVFILFSLSTLACSSRPLLKAIHPARTHVESTVTTTTSGTIEAQQQTALGFGIAGRVQKIYVKVGDIVRAGQVLAEEENVDLKTVYMEAEKELKRTDELFRDGLVSQAALDTAKKNFEVARGNKDKTVIRAPFEGMITESNIEVGELSQPTGPKDRPPFRLVDLKPRLAKGNIDEVDLSQVKIGSPARIRVPALGKSYLEANVTRVVPFVSTTREQDRTSEIELRFKESDHLVPVGASADIEVITQSKSDTLAIPTRLILGRAGQKYVFVYRDGAIYKTSIHIGIGNYDRSEITNGLTAEDTIVYPPDITELKDGLKVKVEIAPWP